MFKESESLNVLKCVYSTFNVTLSALTSLVHEEKNSALY